MGHRPATVVAAALMAAALSTTPALATTTEDATISGTVFLDLDGDGTRDDGEPGRDDVVVSLRTSATVLDATVTGADGSWSFSGLGEGDHTVVVETPIDLEVTTGQPLDGRDAAIELSITEDVAGIEIGFGSQVASGPDLTADIVAAGASTSDGQAVWEIAVHNIGPESAEGPVDVRVVLGAGHDGEAAEGTGWDCDVADSIITCESTPAVAAGASLPLLTVTTTPTGDLGSSIAATVTVRLDGSFDGAPLNDEDVAETTIGSEALEVDDDGDGHADEYPAAGATGLPAMLSAVLVALCLGLVSLRASRRA